MDKPSVYLDTTIISAYWYEGSDLASFARRLKTREWWELERPHFSVWSSAVSEAEFRAGVFRRQAECLSMRLEVICQKLRLRAPLLVSPETIPRVSMGESIRRRNL